MSQSTPDEQSPKYAVGSVVRLNSGGPKMTILALEEEGRVLSCKWFDRNGKVQTDSFVEDMVSPFVSSARS